MSSTPETLPAAPIAAPTASGASPSGGTTAGVAEGTPSRRRGYNVEILLISFAALLLEVSYTRVVSFKLFYYYTYLVIGLALLGIGCGGVVVSLSNRLRTATTEVILMWGLLLGGASVGAGYLVVALTPIATLRIWDYGSASSFKNLGLLLVICLAIFVSFIAIGIMIATLFTRQTERIGRLYFADLIGAGIACGVVVYFIDSIGPPATILLAGLIMAILGLRMAFVDRKRVAGSSWTIPLGLVVAALLFIPMVAPSFLPRQREDTVKTNLTPENTTFSAWSSIFRVDVANTAPGTKPAEKILFHDGLQGSGIYQYNGDVKTLTRFNTDPRSLPYAVLGSAKRKVLIIGAAGGHEILSSLYYNVDRIDAIELNPVTYRLVTGKYADYSGNIADNPHVNYVHGDGRSYLARSKKDYNLVWYPAPDSYAASNAATAGAFVLSESYLYTSDAVQDSLEHLGPNGIVAAQFGEVDYNAKPNRTTRYVSTARRALKNLGVKDPRQHFLVATSPTQLGASTVSTILVKRSAFTPAEVARFTAQIKNVPETSSQYAPGRPTPGRPVSDVITTPNDKLNAWYDTYAYNVRPITDDGPFFWHFNTFPSVIKHIGDPTSAYDFENSTGERVLLLLVGVSTLFAAVFLLLPFLAIRKTWAQLPRKGRSALYFASLGMGFLFFEITLIQRLTLFLGYPTYSLTVTLASLLIFTGVGALLSERFKNKPQRVMPVLFGSIALLTVFYLLGLPKLTEAALGWPLLARVVIAFVLLAPLGVCLGAFMPLGLGAVAALSKEHEREYVAWGWAVNGFASVIGATLTTILAMTFGFHIVLILALAAYLVALLALRGLLAPASAAVGK